MISIESAFAEFDANGDGNISDREFAFGVQSLGVDVSASEMDALVDLLDTDKDGTVSYAEFASFLHYYCKGIDSRADDLCARLRNLVRVAATKNVTLRESFAHFDTDKDGYITHSELSMGLRSLMGFVVTERDAATLMATLDTDGDGKTSFQEFYEFIEYGDRATEAAMLRSLGERIRAAAHAENSSSDRWHEFIDSESTPTVTLNEFTSKLKSLLKISLSKNELESIAALLKDANTPGTISLVLLRSFLAGKLKEGDDKLLGSLRKKLFRYVRSAEAAGVSVRKVFDDFDTDSNSYLSLDEIRAALKALGMILTSYDLQVILAAIDVDNDSRCSYDEFVAFVNGYDGPAENKAKMRGALKWNLFERISDALLFLRVKNEGFATIFAPFDTSELGCISIADFISALESIGITLSRPEICLILEMFSDDTEYSSRAVVYYEKFVKQVSTTHVRHEDVSEDDSANANDGMRFVDGSRKLSQLSCLFKLFHELDDDHDGQVSRHELTKALVRQEIVDQLERGPFSRLASMDDGEINALFHLIDKDASGTISWSEFLAYFRENDQNFSTFAHSMEEGFSMEELSVLRHAFWGRGHTHVHGGRTVEKLSNAISADAFLAMFIDVPSLLAELESEGLQRALSWEEFLGFVRGHTKLPSDVMVHIRILFVVGSSYHWEARHMTNRFARLRLSKCHCSTKALSGEAHAKIKLAITALLQAVETITSSSGSSSLLLCRVYFELARCYEIKALSVKGRSSQQARTLALQWLKSSSGQKQLRGTVTKLLRGDHYHKKTSLVRYYQASVRMTKPQAMDMAKEILIARKIKSLKKTDRSVLVRSKAREAAAHAVQIIEGHLGDDHVDTAMAFVEISMFHMRLQEKKERSAMLERALSILEKLSPPLSNSPLVSRLCSEAALLCKKRDEHSKAALYFHRTAVACMAAQAGYGRNPKISLRPTEPMRDSTRKFLAYASSLDEKIHESVLIVRKQLENMFVQGSADVAFFNATFSAFDRNGDGFISMQELQRGLRKLSINLSAAETQGLMQVIDRNSDDRIAIDELRRQLLPSKKTDVVHYDGVSTAAGHLALLFKKGENLKRVQRFGTQDPYIKVTLSPDNLSMRTTECNNGGNNPDFAANGGNMCEFVVPEVHPENARSLLVEVFDAELIMRDRLIGKGEIDMSTLRLVKSSDATDRDAYAGDFYLNLIDKRGNAAGTLSFQIQFTTLAVRTAFQKKVHHEKQRCWCAQLTSEEREMMRTFCGAVDVAHCRGQRWYREAKNALEKAGEAYAAINEYADAQLVLSYALELSDALNSDAPFRMEAIRLCTLVADASYRAGDNEVALKNLRRVLQVSREAPHTLGKAAQVMVRRCDRLLKRIDCDDLAAKRQAFRENVELEL